MMTNFAMMLQTGCLAICMSTLSCFTEGLDCGRHGGLVSNVLDGDTVELEDGTTVRMIGIDAPEFGTCWYAEARASTEFLVSGREVELEFVSRCTDKYGRLLAHVLVDGQSVEQILARAGAACAWDLETDDPRADEIRDAARIAATTGAGLWGSCGEITCRSR
jgi:micrococcal nuclease